MDRQGCDELIDLVKYGSLTPDEAEAEAARLGLGPLASRPDATQYDNPMEETWWTLPMAIAWIAWRNLNDVLFATIRTGNSAGIGIIKSGGWGRTAQRTRDTF